MAALPPPFPHPVLQHHLEVLNEDGQHTPSHGGIVNSGQEYDLPIHPSPPPNDTQSPPVSATFAPARPRTNSNTKMMSRQRPVSMPPQTFQPPDAVSAETSARQQEHTQTTEASTKKRSSNRILGDYTLSKTLGAGSMGKVKLAHHNQTGEKVSVQSPCNLRNVSKPNTVRFP